MKDMNKEIFLEELRRYLQVLEDQEQDDILEEYAQHIDMKLQKGLSQEEAISDFGPVKELAAEILEAYHVKPEFQKKAPLIKLPNPVRQTGAGKSFFKRTWQFIKEKTEATGRGVKKVCGWIWEKCLALGKFFTKPFRKSVENKAAEEGWSSEEMELLQNGMEAELTQADGGAEVLQDNGKQAVLVALGNSLRLEKAGQKKLRNKNTGRGNRKMRNFFMMTGRVLTAFGRMCLDFCVWCLRLFWNAAWLMFSVICAGMAMIVLMGSGTTIIFLLKGYPLRGFFLICIGGLLCFGALSMGAFSLLIRKKKDTDKGRQDGGESKAAWGKHDNKEESKAEQHEEVTQYE